MSTQSRPRTPKDEYFQQHVAGESTIVSNASLSVPFTVMAWDGNGYLMPKTWISIDSDYVVDLEDWE